MKGLIETMAAGLPALQAKSTDISALTWTFLTGQAASKAGVAVNNDTALRVSTVLACCRVIAEGVSQLPLHVGTNDGEGAFQIQRDDPLFKLLHRQPNLWQTSFEFRETMSYNAILTGWGIAIKNRVRGQVRELLPVPTNYVSWERLPNYDLRFFVNDPFGAVGEFSPRDLVIIRGPSWDGLLPFNIVRLAREAIGLAIATEEAHARLHANGARPGGILSIDGSLSEEARARIKTAAQEFSRGDAFKTMVLDKGATWSAMAMNGVDSQHLETRRLQIEEICRAFRVFPHMVGYADKTTTFASAESFFQGHVLHTLMPWIERWEQALERDILGERNLSARFNVRELLKGDTGARAAFYASGIVNGWLTRNDARRMEGLQPLPGLDEPLAPLNMTTVGAAIDSAENPAAAKAVRLAALAELKSWEDRYGGPPTDDAQREDLTGRVTERIIRVLHAMA